MTEASGSCCIFTARVPQHRISVYSITITCHVISIILYLFHIISIACPNLFALATTASASASADSRQLHTAHITSILIVITADKIIMFSIHHSHLVKFGFYSVFCAPFIVANAAATLLIDVIIVATVPLIVAADTAVAIVLFTSIFFVRKNKSDTTLFDNG